MGWGEEGEAGRKSEPESRDGQVLLLLLLF